MIIGIGCDIVENNRFIGWHAYSYEKLASVFSDSEIKQAEQISDIHQAAQFFASRFAAKEAFYKALSSAFISLEKTSVTVSFVLIRKLVSVEKHAWGVPGLSVDWRAIAQKLASEVPSIQVHLSLSHEKEYSCAFITLEQY